MDILLVIDLQNGVNVNNRLYQIDSIIPQINARIADYRTNHKPILFIQHIDKDLIVDSPSWQLLDALDHQQHDHYLSKTHCNAFFKTNLSLLLNKWGGKRIEFCGAMTEYCVDATIKFAHGLGYECYMTRGLSTTIDGRVLTAAQVIEFIENIWNRRFLTFL